VCTSDASCPTNSYCDTQSGQCVGSWHCDNFGNSCSPGFECDARNTCVPVSCSNDNACQQGCYCDEASSDCIETTTCDSLGNCPGSMVCDTARNTCLPPDAIDGPTCQSTVTCQSAAPICPAGSTPAIENGCYTGSCMAKADCPDGAPFACSDLNNDENACSANSACSSVFKGVNCTAPNGATCTGGTANCTCESFQFDYCEEI